MVVIKTANDMPYQVKKLIAAYVTDSLVTALENAREAERVYEQAEQASFNYKPQYVEDDKPETHRAKADRLDHLMKDRNKAKTELYAARRELGLIAVKWAIQEGLIDD